MVRNWTFGQKVAAGFIFACLVMLTVGVVGYQNTQRSIENELWVSHTYEVRRNIEALISAMKDEETGQRGFIITGEETFLEPYNSALPKIEAAFAELRQLTADNQHQQARLDKMRPVIDEKQVLLKTALQQRRTEGLEAAVRTTKGGEGKRHMDQLRQMCDEMDREEVTLLKVRRDLAAATADMTKKVILWGGLIGSLLIAGIGWFITHSLSKQIGSTAQHMQSSSAELQAAANQQASGAREQTTAMSEITTTMSELLATSRQIADSSRRVFQIAEQATTSARSGTSTVEQGQEAIGAIRRQVDLIVGHMLELGKKSQQIGSVLGIVSELAEQTNILAINATIEAVGAGESGKRFAVVADEIRKLADRVGASAKEIRGLIEDVRAAVNTTVMTTETGSKAVEAGARQFSEVANVFRQMAGQVVNTNDAAREIELSTKQQATAVEQVKVAITNVAQAAKEGETSTSQTLLTASEISRLSTELLRLVQQQQARARAAA